LFRNVAGATVSRADPEHYVALFARLFELPATSVRLFTVYGPRQRKQVVFDLIQRLVVDGPELEVIGDGTQVRDFNHVANVIDAILLVAERGERGGATYNVAGEEAISIAELVERLCDATGLRPKVAYSGDLRPGDSQRWTADITRLRRLGYRPRVHLEEGLADTVRWFREEIAPGLPGST
jgi:UDP-glucose 4-epimerase